MNLWNYFKNYYRRSIIQVISNEIYRYRVIIYILVFVFFVGLYLRTVFKELPSLDTIKEYRPTLSTKLLDVNGQLITEFFIERRTWIPLTQIPVDMQNAAISIEDHKFFKHWGISFKGIVRAFIQNLIRGRISAGGSTITQQLAKLAFLTQEKTLTRKLKELILALQIEWHFSKQEILEMYLNQVYLGHGAYGIEQAAQMYFSKSAVGLNLQESALLASLIRSPHYYSSITQPKRAIIRRSVVLDRMQKLGFITETEKFSVLDEPLKAEKKNLVLTYQNAPYFVEYVRLQIEQEYGSDFLYKAGWNIYTTLDLQMQTTGEMVINEFLSEFDKKQAALQKLKIESFTTTLPPVQVALLAIDHKTGEIKAMVGGRDFQKSQFNRAVQAYRQPGSAFKPIIYTAALEKGYTPTTIIEDTPLVYVNDGRDWRLKSKSTDYLLELPPKWLEDPMKVWTPENYKKKYHGPVLLRQALELSLNACAVRIIEEVGPTTVIEYARKFGIQSPLTNTLSLALGASDVTVIEMVSAFGVLANRGIRTKPYAIRKMVDSQGKIIKENRPVEENVLSEQLCFVITNLLKGVIKRGTGKYASYFLKGKGIAGKTGTANEFTDAWFIGYTPELTCGVWVGYDDKTSLGKNNSGGVIACPIWTHFIKRALKDSTTDDFTVPETGITFANIDADTGYLASDKSKETYPEAFLSGSEPKMVLSSPTTAQLLQKIKEDEEETGF